MLRALLVVALFSAGCSRRDPVSEQARLEGEFERMLTGSVLAGKFAMGDKIAADRYEIAKASKLSGDTWLINAKIGKSALLVPVPVTVKWAGDTPVIQLTDAGIPGLGTFTARVMFFRNEYAGTWSAKDHGGQMWGKVERAK